MRYGPKRIAMLLGLLALVVLSSFTIRNYFRKQNDYVLNSIHEQALKLAASPKTDLGTISSLLTEELKTGQTSVDELIRSIPDSVQRIRMMNGLVSLMIYQGKDEPKIRYPVYFLPQIVCWLLFRCRSITRGYFLPY